MIVASLPAARIIVVKYATSVLDVTVRSSRRTESQTLPSHQKKSISTTTSSSWSRFGRRLKLPMLSFDGSGLMISNWRELPTNEASSYELSPSSSMFPIERDSRNSSSQKERIDESKRKEKEEIT